MAAMSIGVHPSPFALSMAPPTLTSDSTTAKWPFWAATYRGVQPLAMAWSTAALALISACTTARWPFWAAE
jgi:hypothetical protein